MRVIGLSQYFNEAVFARRHMEHLYPLLDRWIISEGLLTPGSHVDERSTDGTRKIVEDFAIGRDKIVVTNTVSPISCNSREQAEGQNKNRMLQLAEPEDGDILCILDADEFWHPERFGWIVDMFRKHDDIEHVPVEEWQFAYNLHLCFRASHDGRFIRYKRGARFGTTNHFIYPDGRDVTKDYHHLVSRGCTQMAHLCWVKHPLLVRDKVLSFNRLSFTEWFNQVYLEWPDDPEKAYRNNYQIAPHYESGYAEGQHAKIESFCGALPPILEDFKDDWLDYVKQNKEKLRI